MSKKNRPPKWLKSKGEKFNGLCMSCGEEIPHGALVIEFADDVRVCKTCSGTLLARNQQPKALFIRLKSGKLTDEERQRERHGRQLLTAFHLALSTRMDPALGAQLMRTALEMNLEPDDVDRIDREEELCARIAP